MCSGAIPLIFLIMGLALAVVLGLVLPRMVKERDVEELMRKRPVSKEDVENFRKWFRQLAITLAVVMAVFAVEVYLLNCLFNITPPVSIGIEPNGTVNGMSTYVVSIQVLESPYWQTHAAWFIFSVKTYANGTPVPCLIKPKPPIGIMPNWWNQDTAFPVPMVTLYCPEKITQAIILTSNGNVTINP